MTAVELDRTLPPSPTSAGEARRLLREVLSESGAGDWVDNAQVAVSELVTNALVHAGTPIRLHVEARSDGLRVEVADGNPHLPRQRSYAPTSGTGRGLHLVEELVDDWGAFADPEGKVVWFEIHEGARSTRRPPLVPVPADAEPPVLVSVQVDLLDVPLLMHLAWQEHAAALLREYLLATMEEDMTVIEQHAQASEALSILHEQVPAPGLAMEPLRVMADAVGPGLVAPRCAVLVPVASLRSFATLDVLLDDALRMASEGDLLCPPVQPEMRELRRWICREVRDQSGTAAAPRPWSPATADEPPPEPPGELAWDAAPVTTSTRALLAVDDANCVVAVSGAAMALLGYRDAGELVGRRLLEVIPERYHQAHIAGFTLHLTNGRAPLIGTRVTVPVRCRDGEEREVGLMITAEGLPRGRRVFTAELVDVGG
jgi:PAS domain S-box-containing protein